MNPFFATVGMRSTQGTFDTGVLQGSPVSNMLTPGSNTRKSSYRADSLAARIDKLNEGTYSPA